MSLAPDDIDQLRYAFHAFDANGSGFIELEEITEGLHALGWNVNQKGIDHIMEVAKSNDDKLSFEEFIAANSVLWKNSMIDKFNELDVDKKGWICKVELKKYAMAMGYGFTEEELDDLTYEMDTSGNGHISVDEFINGMVSCDSMLRQRVTVPYLILNILLLRISTLQEQGILSL